MLNEVACARPMHAHPCRDLAQLLAAAGKPGCIARQYRACLGLAPHDTRLLYAFAEFLREAGDAAAAIALLVPVLQAHRTSAEAQYQMGLALAEAGQFDAAAESFCEPVGCRSFDALASITRLKLSDVAAGEASSLS